MNSIPSNTCILHNFTAVLSLLTDRRRPEYVVLPVDCFSFHATSLMVFLCVLLLLTIIIIISLGNEHQILLFKKYIYSNQEHYGWFYGQTSIYTFIYLWREEWNWQELCTTTTISSSKTRMTTMTLDEDFFLDSWSSPISRQRCFW